MARTDRAPNALRKMHVESRPFGAAPGSVVLTAGRTIVWSSVSIDETVPLWLQGQGKGWITAEYSMLPGSTRPRAKRDRTRVDGRTTEIQRLIGRSLRAVVDLERLGERTLQIDCEVLQADGGTRTASVTAACIALIQALQSLRDPAFATDFPLRTSVAAVSVGVVAGKPMLDLDYAEDAAASVDMNVVMTGSGRYVEIQGTGEEATFDDGQLGELLCLAHGGIRQLTDLQRQALGSDWPFA